ncbi:MAG: hypothetical protein NTW14_10380 [bacterium]|nr:hypothetical protein [bacterium]
MISTITQFDFHWKQEMEATRKIFEALTDASLKQAVNADGRSLGRLAWHLTLTIPEMMAKTCLDLDGPKPGDPTPATAKAIYEGYQTAAKSLLDQINSTWTDETLQIADDMYGQQWIRAYTLTALVMHQIHHRGQMTVLMRQAGLKVPGIYGPAREEWAGFGMPAPEV